MSSTCGYHQSTGASQALTLIWTQKSCNGLVSRTLLQALCYLTLVLVECTHSVQYIAISYCYLSTKYNILPYLGIYPHHIAVYLLNTIHLNKKNVLTAFIYFLLGINYTTCREFQYLTGGFKFAVNLYETEWF